MMAELCDLPMCHGLTFTCFSVVNVFLFTYFGMLHWAKYCTYHPCFNILGFS